MTNRHIIALLVFAGSLALTPAANADSVVRMETVEGNIDLMLLDEKAPITVDNFIRNYVDKGAYNNTIIQRVPKNSPGGVPIIQGGGFVWDDTAQQLAAVPKAAAIPGEYLNGYHNGPGTIAMALFAGDVNSATNQWFINIGDNRANLDPQGFTVFGYLLDMTVANNLYGLPVVDASTLPLGDTLALQAPLPALNPNTDITTLLAGYFGSLPLINYTSGPVDKPNLAVISKIRVMARGPIGTVGTEISVPGDKYAILNLDPADASAGVTVDTFAVAANPDSLNVPAGVTFDQGIYSIKLGHVGPASLNVVLGVPEDQPLQVANTVYKYGPTANDPTPHWYTFMYDNTTRTGAIINGSMVMLAFVDGQRGDDDLTVNGVIGDANDIVAVGTGPVPVSGDGGGGGGAFDIYSLLAGVFVVAWKLRRRASAAVL